MSSTVSDVQKIVVKLSEPDVVIEPGGVAKLVVTMTNRQETPDRLLVEVEGVDIEWYNIPVPAVNVAPGEHAEVRINFKVARNSENRAGSYPFVVRVQAMETGEVGFAEAMLTVKPFDALQVELQPKRVVATFLRPLNDFEVTVANLGNAEETVDLHASDPDDDCAYEYDVDRITLKPGQSETVLLAARPKVSAWVGNTRLYGFSVTARSIEDSYVSGKAQGQIERNALISPLLGIFLLLLGFGGGGYMLFRPTPPAPVSLVAFTAAPSTVLSGQQITLSWNVQGDRPNIILQHRVGSDGTEVFDGKESIAVGKIPVTMETTEVRETVYYTLHVSGPGGKPQSKTVAVEVIPAPAPPKPVIRSFNADTTVIHQGEQITLTWTAVNQTGFILDPGGLKFSKYDESTTVAPNPPTLDQDVVYTLRALAQDPNAPPADKTVHVKVVSRDTCIAVIDRFKTTPKPVYFGDKVHLHWSTRRARMVSIVTDKGDTIGANLPTSGSLEASINEKTTFQLTVADNLGKTNTQSITVDPQPKPLPPPVDNTPMPGATTTPPANSGPTPPQDGANPPNPATSGSSNYPNSPPGKP